LKLKPVQDDQGTTPIQLAAYGQKEELVKLLIKHLADAELADRKGINALIACAIGYLKITEELAEQKKRLDQYSSSEEVSNDIEDKTEKAIERIKAILDSILPVVKNVNKTEDVSLSNCFRLETNLLKGSG
jgi:ankyrin repeat protein